MNLRWRLHQLGEELERIPGVVWFAGAGLLYLTLLSSHGPLKHLPPAHETQQVCLDSTRTADGSETTHIRDTTTDLGRLTVGRAILDGQQATADACPLPPSVNPTQPLGQIVCQITNGDLFTADLTCTREVFG